MAHNDISRSIQPWGWQLLALTALALMLGGCVSSAEIVRLNTERDIQRCTEFGFRPGTQAFAECRLTLDQRREDERVTIHATTWGGFYSVPPAGPCWYTRWGVRCDPW